MELETIRITGSPMVVEGRSADLNEDEILIARCQSGDKAAFGILVRKYQDLVYRLIYRLLGETPDMEDIAQEIFIRAYKGIGRFRGDARFSTWLTRICINYCRKRRHKAKRDLISLEQFMSQGYDFADGSAMPDRILERKEYRELVRQAIDNLPQKYRIVIILRYFEAYSCEQIAEILSCPVGTVYSRLFRAHEKLRKRLKSIGFFK
ncbi:sigma-70 family RNA polymerase sigma factor [Candidatus Poribacteria bacterium]|nr:sigma-70 family RNA polymerase sigma factor [Candidatus Poribacteria bacterium]